MTSNTATAATFIPVLCGVAAGIGADPMTLLIPATLAATCVFMLPVPPHRHRVRNRGGDHWADGGGGASNIIGILLFTARCYLLGGLALGLTF